jgi:hypothetical protein
MGFDKRGRWVPDGEALPWLNKSDNQGVKAREHLRRELTESGLDWRHQGKYAFRTNAWADMTETQRFKVLEAYDSWYDSGHQENLADEAWGLDIERGISYNAAIPDDGKKASLTYKKGSTKKTTNWSAQMAFHMLSGGTGTIKELKGTKEDIQNTYDYDEKVRHTVLGEYTKGEKENLKHYTTIIEREYPMDWKHYTNDELYRAAIDEVLEDHYYMFMGPGADFDNATQVRAASQEIQSWVNEQYTLAGEEADKGATPAQIGAVGEAKWEKYKEFQIASAKVHNQRYPEGQTTRGFQHGQQRAIRKYQPWNRFDPETGTRTTLNPITGEVKDTFKHVSAANPTRMTISSDATQNVDEGIFYSPTVNKQEEIERSIMEVNKTADITKPIITSRTLQNYKPANFDPDWEVDGLNSKSQ